jgi:hypothetical protein
MITGVYQAAAGGCCRKDDSERSALRMGQESNGVAVAHPVGLPRARRELRTLALAVAVAFVALLGVALAGATPSRAATARTARTFSLSERGRLHLTSHHSFTLNEQGSASGTISGTIYIHLNVVSTNRVTAEVNIYPSGGSLTGYASAGYHPSGGVATFSGTMSVTRGTGRYRHAHGSGLSFTGTVQRSNDAVTVHVSGRMSA